jgi:hypothetical protein
VFLKDTCERTPTRKIQSICTNTFTPIAPATAMFPPAAARICFYELLLSALDMGACAGLVAFRLVYGNVEPATPAQVEAYLEAHRASTGVTTH